MPGKRKRKPPISDSSEEATNSVKKLKKGKSSHQEKIVTEEQHLLEDLTKRSVPEMKSRLPSIGQKYVGAHTSISGGLYNAVLETIEMGGFAFAMFLKSQRQWNSKPLLDADAKRFQDTLKTQGISPKMVVPHGSYLMNCGSPDADTLSKSRAMLLDEMQRCERLGLHMFNFHPGSSCGKISASESIERIAESINQVHEKTQGSKVVAVLENMSCQGNTLGGKFEELRDIICKVKDKSRVGVCLDTCHLFAAGFELRTETGYTETMSQFDKTVGFQYLQAVHVNDSKGDLGCHKDRHENIGKGKLGLSAFKNLMNDPRFNDIPMILETPSCDYSKEINTLYRLCDKKKTKC